MESHSSRPNPPHKKDAVVALVPHDDVEVPKQKVKALMEAEVNLRIPGALYGRQC